ncbi:MAG TPA: DUF1295 domain-containing protein [Sandaracinaceae bacterium LLY-WYZ-13_1]|nr:DUF1295 domain-containing protein [Sandaracinaceae bacterium LLY-WYZ-13_1]
MPGPRVLAFGAYAVFIVAVVVIADVGDTREVFGFVKAVPLGDELGHVALVALADLAFPRVVRVGAVPIPVAATTVAALVVLEELSQLALPTVLGPGRPHRGRARHRRPGGGRPVDAPPPSGRRGRSGSTLAPVNEKVRGILVLVLVYAAALAGAGAAIRWGPALDPPWDAALADAVATVVVFGFSLGLRNSSAYDPYWSVAPPALFAFWLARGDASPRAWIAGVLVVAWGARLTWNFLRGWKGLAAQDWRYDDLETKTGHAYWLVSFLGIHLMPSVLTFVGSLPLFLIASRPDTPLSPLDAAAALVTLLGIGYEAVADEQLRRFVARRPPKGTWLDAGLWRHSRHPNYFGEITFWVGLSLFGLAAAPGAWWVLVGPAGMLALFLGVSIPMMDRRMIARRPGYAEHARRVSALVPWLRRGAAQSQAKDSQ